MRLIAHLCVVAGVSLDKEAPSEDRAEGIVDMVADLNGRECLQILLQAGAKQNVLLHK